MYIDIGHSILSSREVTLNFLYFLVLSTQKCACFSKFYFSNDGHFGFNELVIFFHKKASISTRAYPRINLNHL